jgi:hypothetical protein
MDAENYIPYEECQIRTEGSGFGAWKFSA